MTAKWLLDLLFAGLAVGLLAFGCLALASLCQEFLDIRGVWTRRTVAEFGILLCIPALILGAGAWMLLRLAA